MQLNKTHSVIIVGYANYLNQRPRWGAPLGAHISKNYTSRPDDTFNKLFEDEAIDICFRLTRRLR